MKKITEIYIQKEYMKSERDFYGNRIKTPTIGSFKREVVLASQGLRLAHYLIDLVVLYFVSILILLPLVFAAPRALYSISQVGYTVDIGVYQIQYDLLSYVIVLLYYLITESTMQRSIGKFVTNTVVIDEYGNKPAFKTILGRSLMRLVPFDAFSCLGSRGWHDKVSRTYVVKRKEADELKRLLKETDGMFLSDSEELLD